MTSKNRKRVLQFPNILMKIDLFHIRDTQIKTPDSEQVKKIWNFIQGIFFPGNSFLLFFHFFVVEAIYVLANIMSTNVFRFMSQERNSIY